ncbi:hypothetical protein ABZ848_21970 [Streptomyces sp. NPDC047081]|uniref:hypothetical protein n=1 Tax=Streptomyces sp. NPDC047081 TaxID=3154706 RepID=UPI0033E19570
MTTAEERLGTERVRSLSGAAAVFFGDAAVAVAASIGVLHVAGTTNGSAQIVGILSAAFTAVSTTTTAYFGIKAMSNTAQRNPGISAPTAPPGTEPPSPTA